MRYKSDKEHVISDALFKLASLNKTKHKDYSELDALFTVTLMKMLIDFYIKVLFDY